MTSQLNANVSAPRPEHTDTIGNVVKRLQHEFPDLTVSQIRYYEDEGLLTVSRTEKGYRRFKERDIQRLHYILTEQRDHYLPLKVIKENLEAMDAGKLSPLHLGSAAPVVDPERFKPAKRTRLTDNDLAKQTSVSIDTILELIENNIITPDQMGLFSDDDVAIVSAVSGLLRFGIDVRHIRQQKHSTDRVCALINQVAMRRAAAHGSTAKEHADELTMQLCSLMVSLHAALVKKTLAKHPM